MALAECTTYYFRELLLRMIFHGTVPPWEDATGGTPYQWTPTQFVMGLHTADPGEAGGPSTTPMTYAEYEPVLVARSAAAWTLSGAGTSTPKMATASQIAWPANLDADQDCLAVSIAMRDGVTDHGMARDAFAAVTVDGPPDNDVPVLGAGAFAYWIR